MFEKIQRRLKGTTFFLISLLFVGVLILTILNINYHASLGAIKTKSTFENILSLCILVYFLVIFFGGCYVLSKQNKIKNTLVYYKNVSSI